MISLVNKSIRRLVPLFALLVLCVSLSPSAATSAAPLPQDPKEDSTQLHPGIFRAGTYDAGAYVGKPWDDFHAKWQELEAKNLRMVDIEIYEAGGKTVFAELCPKSRDITRLSVQAQIPSEK